MLYTIIPDEEIFADREGRSHFEEVVYLGRRLLVQSIDKRRCQIVQLISSDPNDFLLPALSPGNIINMP